MPVVQVGLSRKEISRIPQDPMFSLYSELQSNLEEDGYQRKSPGTLGNYSAPVMSPKPLAFCSVLGRRNPDAGCNYAAH